MVLFIACDFCTLQLCYETNLWPWARDRRWINKSNLQHFLLNSTQKLICLAWCILFKQSILFRPSLCKEICLCLILWIDIELLFRPKSSGSNYFCQETMHASGRFQYHSRFISNLSQIKSACSQYVHTGQTPIKPHNINSKFIDGSQMDQVRMSCMGHGGSLTSVRGISHSLTFRRFRCHLFG